MDINITPEFHTGMCANEGPAAKLSWHKSERSNANGQCVEVAKLPGGGVAVRDSKNPSGPALVFTDGEAQAFGQGVQDGEFDSDFGLA